MKPDIAELLKIYNSVAWRSMDQKARRRVHKEIQEAIKEKQENE